MLFILILIIFSFITYISLYGDYETKEKKKDYEKMEGKDENKNGKSKSKNR